MSFKTATTWVARAVKDLDEPFGKERLRESIQWMSHGVISRAPENILNDVANAGKFVLFMRALMSTLFDGKPVGLIVSNICQKAVPTGDPIGRFIAKIHGVHAVTTPGSPARAQSVELIAKMLLKRIDAYVKPGVLTDIFAVAMGFRTVQHIDRADTAGIMFKLRVLKRLALLQGSRAALDELDHYFISLAAAGPGASSIYSNHEIDVPVNETCEMRSLSHPEFDIEHFMYRGPIAMFYNNIGMMAEIAFVLESNADNVCMLSLHWMLQLYSDKLIYGGTYSRTGPGRMFDYLAKLHGITQKSNACIWEQLKTLLGDRIGHPAYAFARRV